MTSAPGMASNEKKKPKVNIDVIQGPAATCTVSLATPGHVEPPSASTL
jgi:hypothetical protein